MSEKTIRLKFRSKTSGLKSYHCSPGLNVKDGDEFSCTESEAKYLLETFGDYFFPVKGTVVFLDDADAEKDKGKAAAQPAENKAERPPAWNKGKK